MDSSNITFEDYHFHGYTGLQAKVTLKMKKAIKKPSDTENHISLSSCCQSSASVMPSSSFRARLMRSSSSISSSATSSIWAVIISVLVSMTVLFEARKGSTVSVVEVEGLVALSSDLNVEAGIVAVPYWHNVHIWVRSEASDITSERKSSTDAAENVGTKSAPLITEVTKCVPDSAKSQGSASCNIYLNLLRELAAPVGEVLALCVEGGLDATPAGFAEKLKAPLKPSRRNLEEVIFSLIDQGIKLLVNMTSDATGLVTEELQYWIEQVNHERR
ncbi:hypothetical protein M5K25_018583 [Dendrobium thyrsiflorum]|uniref:Uncharacterized protein n=1 Tax=Dendrobium thyrsiflorum TaxID=117978 RepID=A0ABD0UIQ4_DENTH